MHWPDKTDWNLWNMFGKVTIYCRSLYYCLHNNKVRHTNHTRGSRVYIILWWLYRMYGILIFIKRSTLPQLSLCSLSLFISLSLWTHRWGVVNGSLQSEIVFLKKRYSIITLIKRHNCYLSETQTIATLPWDDKVKLQRNPGSVAVGGNVVCVSVSFYNEHTFAFTYSSGSQTGVCKVT